MNEFNNQNILNDAPQSKVGIAEKVISTAIKVEKPFAVAGGIVTLLGQSVFFIIVGCILYYFVTKGFPIMIFLGFVVFMCLLEIVSIVQLKSDFISSQKIPKKTILPQIVLDSEEKIIFTVSGIMRTVGSIKDLVPIVEHPFSYSAIRQLKSPENALIITNRALYFVYVPMEKGDKQYYSMDTQMAYFFWEKKVIADKLNNMLTSMPLAQVINSYPYNYAIKFTDIKSIKKSGLGGGCITIVKKDNKKITYSIRDKNDIPKILFNTILS